MSGDSFVRAWQDGALLILGAVLAGAAATGVLWSFGRPTPVLGVGAFAGAALAAFLALSYRYDGR